MGLDMNGFKFLAQTWKILLMHVSLLPHMRSETIPFISLSPFMRREENWWRKSWKPFLFRTWASMKEMGNDLDAAYARSARALVLVSFAGRRPQAMTDCSGCSGVWGASTDVDNDGWCELKVTALAKMVVTMLKVMQIRDNGDWGQMFQVCLLPLNFFSQPLSLFFTFLFWDWDSERRELGIFGEGSSVGSVDVIIGNWMHGWKVNGFWGGQTSGFWITGDLVVV